jgi:hypothetical protein
MFVRNATATWERRESWTEEANSAVGRSDGLSQPASAAGRAFARSFVNGFGRLFDVFTPLKAPEPLPPFESTIGEDLHELCLALGISTADEDSATSESSP